MAKSRFCYCHICIYCPLLFCGLLIGIIAGCIQNNSEGIVADATFDFDATVISLNPAYTIKDSVPVQNHSLWQLKCNHIDMRQASSNGKHEGNAGIFYLKNPVYIFNDSPLNVSGNRYRFAVRKAEPNIICAAKSLTSSGKKHTRSDYNDLLKKRADRPTQKKGTPSD